MEELVYLKNDQAITDSLILAEMFEKRHGDVIRAIENKIKNDSTQNCVQCFFKTRYKDDSGKWNTKYLMNRDGFAFIAMGFTGKKADEWKWKYIHAFDAMESFIREKKTEPWIDVRNRGKIARKEETDMIQRLVEYAKGQGSKHSQWLYKIYTKLANDMAGIKTERDEADVEALNRLLMVERIVKKEIEKGMSNGDHYKEIYKACKLRLEQFLEIAYLEAV